jgi:hypothetical protein
VISREEGVDDVKSSWPLRDGLHTCYNGGDNGQRRGDLERIPKSRLSSDCTLQLGCMKAESLVIVDQHATVNTFPGLVHTARHTMGVGLTRRRCANRKEAGDHGRVSDWGDGRRELVLSSYGVIGVRAQSEPIWRDAPSSFLFLIIRTRWREPATGL